MQNVTFNKKGLFIPTELLQSLVWEADKTLKINLKPAQNTLSTDKQTEIDEWVNQAFGMIKTADTQSHTHSALHASIKPQTLNGNYNYTVEEQQSIEQWVERTAGMVRVNTKGKDVDLMNFDVSDHITLFDETFDKKFIKKSASIGSAVPVVEPT